MHPEPHDLLAIEFGTVPAGYGRAIQFVFSWRGHIVQTPATRFDMTWADDQQKMGEIRLHHRTIAHRMICDKLDALRVEPPS